VVKRPAVERQDAAYLTADEAHRLLDAIRGDRLEALFRLMLATGLRRGEALALHWSDIDLDGGALRVRWTLTRTSKGLQLDEPKTEKSRRAVPLPGSAVDMVRAHQSRQATDRLAAHEVWRDSDLVFTTEIGTPLEPRNVLRRFELLAQRAGLRGVHLHTLRHSAASFLLAAGTHTKVVQEHLGHSSYAITADIYSHVAPEQKRKPPTGSTRRSTGDLAVRRRRCCTGCCTHAGGGPALSANPPLTCSFTVGLTGFEPATP
jgi:integrase